MQDLKENKKPAQDGETKQYIGKTIRVFLSYSHKDKGLIGLVKSFLEWYGLEVFIAHEDIKPSSEWEKVIWQNLESIDIFIPIITNNFSLSKWTDQESGIALAKDKFIIPISIAGNVPYGFLNKLQALKFKMKDEDEIDESCDKIIEIIKKEGKFTKALIDSFIKTLPNISSFKQADSKIPFLSTFDSLTEEQVNEIIKHSIQHRQIHASWHYNRVTKSYFENLIKKYKKLINKKLLSQLIELLQEES